MTTFLTVAIALVSVLLMGAVLIQNPKGGGIDQTLGGSTNQIFGAARSADFIEQATWWLALTLGALCIITVMTLGGAAAGEQQLLSQ